jgi:hypothetical protein
MDAHIGEAPIYVNAEQTAEAWLHDNGEVMTKPEILGQTTFTVEIVQPDGQAAETPLADAGMAGDRASGDGVYSNLLAFAQPGQHQIRVIAKNPNFQREKAIIVTVAAPTVDTTQAPMPEPMPATEPTPEPQVEAPADAPPVIEETIKEEPVPEEGMNLGLMVSLFVLVNIVIAAGVGGFLFWRKRKAAKAAADTTETEADEEK